MRFSLISPVFGRPEEVREFLESLLQQNHSDFEVILGDGTPGDALAEVLALYVGNPRYPLDRVYQEYLPVSDARNRAALRAKGDYLIFFDSDCLIPPDYLARIEAHLEREPLDLFGGPDKASAEFNTLQKAISYAMTAPLTTGGIRGSTTRIGVYHPRGFNMGVRAEAFHTVGGYDTGLKCGEDVDLSIRLHKAGYRSGLIPEAYVFHKRRNTLRSFFRQVYRFGAARIDLYVRHRHSLKLTHGFPAAFLLFSLFSLLALPWSPVPLGLLSAYLLAIAIDATVKNRSVRVGLLAVLAAVVMHAGYGSGFLRNTLEHLVFQRGVRL
ncbi:glycosyltransferase [bacterium]|nr:glycosyltransferase [bacterium]